MWTEEDRLTLREACTSMCIERVQRVAPRRLTHNLFFWAANLAMQKGKADKKRAAAASVTVI